MSKNRIKSCFLGLLETKKLSQITVTEICKQADLNRGSFYLHYKDPYDLFEVLRKEFIQEVKELMGKNKQPCVEEEAMIQLLRIIYERKSIYRIMISENQENNLLPEILHDIKEDFYRQKEAENDGIRTPHMDYSFTYMVYGSAGIIDQWLATTQETSPQTIAQIISDFTRAAMGFSDSKQMNSVASVL